jgi:hypothetical protein
MQEIFSTTIRVGAFVAGLAILGAPVHAHDMKQDCTKIDNDIARLSCFDEAFAGQSETVLTPEKAAAKFKALLDLDMPDEIMDVDINPWNPCSVTITWKSRRVDTRSSEQIVSAAVSTFDADRIEGLGRWSAVQKGTTYVELIGSRDAKFFQRNYSGSTPIMQLKDVNPDRLIGARVNVGRKIRAYLLATPFREDTAKAAESLRAYMTACQR